jgi:hypothetical protein
MLARLNAPATRAMFRLLNPDIGLKKGDGRIPSPWPSQATVVGR